MDSLPVVDIVEDYNYRGLAINAVEEGISPVIPLLEKELDTFIGATATEQTRYEAQSILYSALNNWINQGYMHKLNDKWQVDIVKLVANELGYDIVVGKPVSNGSSSKTDTNKTGYSGLSNMTYDGSGLWCAVRNEGTIHTSPNGITWTEKGRALARCLMDKSDNLIPQLKRIPELIEWFGEKINDKILDNAIEKYRNEKILDIAGIE